MKILEQPLHEYLVGVDIEFDDGVLYEKIKNLIGRYISDLNLIQPPTKIPRRILKTIKRDYNYIYQQKLNHLKSQMMRDIRTPNKEDLVEKLFKDIDDVCT